MNITFGSGSNMPNGMNDFNGMNYTNGIQFVAKKMTLLGAIFMVLFGAIFFGAGFLFHRMAAIDKSWPRVDGQVIDVNVSYNSSSHSSSTTYAPIVKYDVKGTSYKATSSISSSSRPTLGSTMQVAYNPTHPEEAKIVQSGLVNILTYVFMGVGVLVAGGGIFAYVKGRNKPDAGTSFTPLANANITPAPSMQPMQPPAAPTMTSPVPSQPTQQPPTQFPPVVPPTQ